MNTFVAFLLVLYAALLQFDVLSVKEDETALKLFALAFAGILLLRAEIKDLKDGRK